MTELEKAARGYIDSHPNSKMSYPEWDGADAYDSFIAGAQWQAKQSPWISVEELLPDECQEVFVFVMNDGIPRIREEKFYRKTYLDKSAKWIHGNSKVLAWMPIPSFHDILETKTYYNELNRKKIPYEQK